jgi:demethylmenaquinone methyltransferase/2-methoxy-6-polyprenyl-1,4-benzoquinol methylase
MFDRLAPRYDRVNRVITLRMDRRWRRDVVRRLAIGGNDRVLDLACGTGDFWALARQAGAVAVGLDYSAGMLRVAAHRHGRALAVVRGDALRLPFASGAFTAVCSGFALRNFTALAPVLVEVHRVLAPGGRLGLLEVDRPRRRALRNAHGLYFERLVPLVGAAISGDRAAYRYLPRSAAYLPGEEELRGLLESAGFRDVRKVGYALGAAQAILAVRA